MSKCLYCKSESLKFLTEDDEFTYKGKTVQRTVEFTHCENCGREYIPKQQILKNEAVVRDIKKSIDGLLTSEEIRKARIELGLTQEQAAVIFGGGRNAFSKYERGEVSQSVAMDKLIRVSMRYPFVLKELLIEAGINSQLDAQEYSDNIIYIPQENDRNKGCQFISRTELIDSKEEIEWTKVS